MRGHPPPQHTHTGETLGGGGAGSPAHSGPDAYELLKTPSHRLVRSQYCGIVWVKEEGSWRDFEICARPKVGGGRIPPSAPPPGKWGGTSGLLAPPPCSYRSRISLLLVKLNPAVWVGPGGMVLRQHWLEVQKAFIPITSVDGVEMEYNTTNGRKKKEETNPEMK